jgi:hypothetical protein
VIGLLVQALPLLAALTIAIDSAAPSPEALAIALQSCREAVGAPSCHTREELQQRAEQAEIEAIVRWDAAYLEADIELRDRASAEPASRRRVVFSSADDLAERFRALGLIVAAQSFSEFRNEPPAPETPAPPVAIIEPRAPLTLALDLFASLATALDRGGPRAGLGLRGWLRPAGWPASFTLTTKGSYRPDDTRIFWAGLAAGLGLHVVPRADLLSIDGRLEFVAQRTHVVATDPSTGARDQAGSLRWGGQLGAELAVHAYRSLWLFLGGELTYMRPELRVRVSGRELGREPSLGGALLAGVRYRW